MKLLPKIILTTLVPVGMVSSAGVMLLVQHPHPPAALAWLIIGMTTVVALTASLLLRNILMRPLESLMQAHAQLQNGDRLVRVRVDGNDEIAELSESFNRMANALQSTEQRFRTIFEAFPSPIILHRVADARLIDANPAFCAQSGIARDRLIGRTLFEAGLAVDPELEQLQVDRLKAAGRLDSVELCIGTEESGKRWALVNTRAIALGDEQVALTVAIDITQLKATENALRNANAQLRMFSAMVESSGEAMLLLRDDKCIDCNPAALTMFGRSRDQLIGHDPLEFSPAQQPGGEDSRARAANYTATIKDNAARHGRWQYVRLDGTPFSVAATVSLLREQFDDGGQYVVVVLRDVTEQERQTQALQQSEQRFRTIFDAFPSYVTLQRVADRRFIDANPTFCEHYGLRRDQLHGRTAEELGLATNDQTRQTLINSLHNRDHTLEVSLRTRAGELRWALLNTRVIELDGEMVTLTVAIDVTLQKKAEQELHEANARLHVINAMVQSSNDAMVLLNPDGTCADCNPASLTMFGCRREELIGTHPGRLSPPYQDDGTASGAGAEALIKATLTGVPQRFLWKHIRLDGTPFLAEVALSRLTGESDADARLVAVLRDVTEQHRANTALLESEQRFRSVFESFPSPITLSRLSDRRYLDVNPAFCELAGFRRDEVLGHTLAELGLPNSAMSPQQVQRLLETGRLDEEAIRATNRWGNTMWALVSIRIIDIGGEPAALAMSVDITRQKHIEEALRQANARLQEYGAMVQGSSEAMLLINHDGVPVDCNDAALRMFGCERELLLSVDALRFAPPQQPDGSDSAATMRAQIRAALGGTPQRFLSQHLRADGTPFMTEVALSRLEDDNTINHNVDLDIESNFDHNVDHNTDYNNSGRLVAVLRDVTEQQRAKDALSDSERRFKAVFDAFPYSIVLISLETGCYVDVNPAFCRLLDISPEQAIGHTPNELGLSNISPEVLRNEVMRHGGRIDEALAQTTIGEGPPKWILYSVRAVDLGSTRAALWVSIDITPQKQIEAALRKANERLQQISAMVQGSSEAMLLLDHDGTPLDCNDAALHMFGGRREDIVGASPQTFVPARQPDHIESAGSIQSMIAAVRQGKPQRYLRQHRRLDGTLFMAEVAMSQLDNDIPERCYLVAVLRDVTEQQQAKQALIASEARFREVFDAFPYPIVLSDLDTNHYIDVNPAFCRLRNISHAQAVERTPAELGITDAAPDTLRLKLQQQNGRLDQALAQVRGASGELQWVLYSARIIKQGGKQMALSVAIDVTRQKEVEQELHQLNASLETRVAERTRELLEALDTLTHAQEELVHAEKLAALGSLVAGIAHELNTPIGNAVMMASTLADQERDFARLMEAGLTRSALQRFATTVHESSDILLRSLRRAAELITSFKQVAIDQSSYQRRRFTLDEVVQEIALTLSPSLRHSGVALLINVPTGIELDSYPGPLGQVLMNLISNAVVHAFNSSADKPSDRTDGTVVIASRDVGANRIGISVTDNGCGMPAEVQNRIFEPFFTTRLGQGGSGLGLHITYNLVTGLLGGSIRVHSAVGSGTWFDIELPMAAPIVAEAS